MMKWLCLYLLPVMAFAVPQEVVFNISQPSTGVVGISLTGVVTGSDSEILTYSGSITASIDIDPETGRLSSFNFRDGSITNNDFSLSIVLGTISVRNAVRRFQSRSSMDVFYADDVTNTGSFSLNNEIVQTYQGQLLFNGIQEEDYATNDDLVDLIGDTVLIESIEEDSLATIESAVWNLNLTIPFRVQDIDVDPDLTITETEVGMIRATARVTVPSGYGEWAIANNVVAGSAFDSDNQGIPYLLSYAFDMVPNSSEALPISTTLDSMGNPEIMITPPSSGMNREVQVEYSPDLATPFLPLSNFLSSTNQSDALLTLGQTTTVALPYPSTMDGKGFIRLSSK